MPYLPDLSPSPCSSLTDSLLVFSPAVSGLARRNRWRDACFIRKLRINLKALSIAGYVNGNLMRSTLYRSPVNGYRLTVRGHTNENLLTDNRQLLTDHFAKSHKSLNPGSDLHPLVIPNKSSRGAHPRFRPEAGPPSTRSSSGILPAPVAETRTGAQ